MSYSSLSSVQTSQPGCSRQISCQHSQSLCSWSSEDKRLAHDSAHPETILTRSLCSSSPPETPLQYVHFDRLSLQSGPLTLSVPAADTAIIDPLTPWLVIPQSLAGSFHTLAPHAIPQRAVLGPRGTSIPFALPCSTSLSISLHLGDTNLTIFPQDLLLDSNSAHSGTCITNLHTWVNPNQKSLILGSLFAQALHVTGSALECIAAGRFDKRHSRLYNDDHDGRWKKAVIGGTIGGVVGAAFLALGAFLLFRLCRGGGARRRGDNPSRSIEFVQPADRQLPHSIDKSTDPQQSNPASRHAPSRSPDMPIPLQSVASPDVKSTHTPPAAGPSSLPQPPAPFRLQRIDRGGEVRTSSGSQFTEHFGDLPPEYLRSRSPLGDEPLPRTPFHPLASTSGSSRAVGNVQPEPALSFVPFDAHSQKADVRTASSSSHRKGSASPKNSLPPGAASPVESIGSYKPAEEPHSRDVSI